MQTEKMILVVEDEARVLRLTSTLLRNAGYRVQEATGPELALQRIAEYPPDGIIMDIRMPVMQGTNLLQLLRANPATRHTPAIAMSGDPSLAEDGVRPSGFAAFLRKPFTKEELLAIVRYFIG